MNRPGNENVTRHTSPPLILHDFPRGEIAERAKIVGWYLLFAAGTFGGSRTCVVLFARGKHRSKNTSLENDIILSRETQPIIQQHVFVARRARTAAALQGILGARSCRVAITFPRKSTNFYPVTCWRAITVALNSNIAPRCFCSDNEFRRFPSYQVLF